MRILLVGIVTGFAGQPLVSALLQFVPLFVTGSALRGRRLGCCLSKGANCPKQKANEG